MAAYVLGLPTPSFSKNLIIDASEYLAGGFVKCWVGITLSHEIFFPTESGGKITSSFISP